MTLNGEIIQMKGNYPNPTHPSTLQYLWAFLFHPMLMLLHLEPLIIFATWFCLCSLFPFPFLIMFSPSSSSQPFIPSSLSVSFIFPSLYILCPLTCQNTSFPLSAVFNSFFFPHCCCFFFYFFVSLLKGTTGHKGPLWKRTQISILFLFWG